MNRRERKERACKGKRPVYSGIERYSENSFASVLPSKVTVSSKCKDKGKSDCVSTLSESSESLDSGVIKRSVLTRPLFVNTGIISDSSDGSVMDGMDGYEGDSIVSRDRDGELREGIGNVEGVDNSVNPSLSADGRESDSAVMRTFMLSFTDAMRNLGPRVDLLVRPLVETETGKPLPWLPTRRVRIS